MRFVKVKRRPAQKKREQRLAFTVLLLQLVDHALSIVEKLIK